MSIPEKIILFGEIYTIKKVTKHELTCEECAEKCIGKIDPEEKLIQIAIDDDEMTEEELLLHELGHYFGRVITGEDNESSANSFAHYVLSIIKQLGYKK